MKESISRKVGISEVQVSEELKKVTLLKQWMPTSRKPGYFAI